METLTDKRFDSPRALFMQLVADGIISKADLGDLPVTRHIIPEYELIREFAEWYKSNHTHGIDWSEKRDGYGGVQTDYCLTYDHAKQFFEYRKDRIRQVQALFNTASGQPQRLTIPDNILSELENERLITKEPLKWIGANNLCAYFVDCFFPKHFKNKWKTAETLFGVSNLRQAKDLYQNNKTTGKPKNYQIIDCILEKYR